MAGQDRKRAVINLCNEYVEWTFIKFVLLNDRKVLQSFPMLPLCPRDCHLRCNRFMPMLFNGWKRKILILVYWSNWIVRKSRCKTYFIIGAANEVTDIRREPIYPSDIYYYPK